MIETEPQVAPQTISTLAPYAPLWRMTVEQYHTMIEAGVLPSGAPVELVEGLLVEKMSKNPPQCFTRYMARKALEAVAPEGWYVESQEPMTLGDSEPEPYVMVVRGDSASYARRHPGAGEVALVVEVADTTLARDRGVKARVYARAGIAEYWLVDLTAQRVEVRTRPEGDGYAEVPVLGGGDELPVVADGAAWGVIAVSALLPR
jgi:Uma2 family endonuclease